MGPETTTRKWWVLVSIGVGTFMSALDGSVVNVLLPVLRSALHSDVAVIEWVATIYLLVVSGLLLGFGRYGDLRGHKRVYLLGLGGFSAASAVCGLAPTAHWLIAARAAQAVFAAMMYANSPAILTGTFPASQRGTALGLQAMMTYLGLTAGPSLGGVLAQHLGWRSVFYINVPVGLVGFFLGAKFIVRDEPAREPPPFDRLGAGLFFVGLLALMLALNQGHAWGWTSPATLALGAGAVAVLIGFVLRERHTEHPMLDLSLFSSRTFSGATASAVLNYISLYSVLFLVPFYLIEERGFGPQHAGLLLTAQPIVMMAAAPLSGAISDRVGTRWPALVGLTLLAGGLYWLSRLDHIVLPLALCGLGTGIFIAPNNSALMGAAPKARQGIAAGVLATARNVGMVLGIGLSGAFLTTLHAKGIASGLVTAAALSLVGAGIAGMRGP